MSNCLSRTACRAFRGSFRIGRVNVWAPFVLAFVMAMMLTASAWAQLSGKGSITGTVTDPSGAVVPGATVTAINPDTGAKV
jgi:hypothetical protein